MVEAAERLFAERGLHGVSMREVAAAAGQRNNSAVQYHFGSREGLVHAVFAYRMRDINLARQEVLDELDRQGQGSDVRALVRAYLVPLAEFLESAPEGHYAQFIASAAPVTNFTDADLREVTDALLEVARRLALSLPQLSPEAARARVYLVLGMLPSALAAHEQRQLAGLPQLHASFQHLVDDLVDTGVAALQAAPGQQN